MITETVLSRSIRLMFASGLVLGSMQVASAQEAASQQCNGLKLPVRVFLR